MRAIKTRTKNVVYDHLADADEAGDAAGRPEPEWKAPLGVRALAWATLLTLLAASVQLFLLGLNLNFAV
jgi:hypothetical protein